MGQAGIDNIQTTDIDCFDNENGSVSFEATFDEVFVMPIDTVFSDGIRLYENGAFPAGNICISRWLLLAFIKVALQILVNSSE